MSNKNDSRYTPKNNIRLDGHDYWSESPYFVTLCTQGRACRLGQVVDDNMTPNSAGIAVMDAWLKIPSHYSLVVLDEFVVMPNHFHGIIWLAEDSETAAAIREQACMTVAATLGSRAGLGPALTTETKIAPTRDECDNTEARMVGLSEVVRAFKSFSAREVNLLYKATGQSLWQRGYYEHAIRNQRSLEHIRQYIADNPSRCRLTVTIHTLHTWKRKKRGS